MKIKCETCRYGESFDAIFENHKDAKTLSGGKEIVCMWGPQTFYKRIDEWCHRWKRILGEPANIEQPAENEE